MLGADVVPWPTDLVSTLTGAGTGIGGVIAVVIIFLRYITSRDQALQDVLSKNTDAFLKMSESHNVLSREIEILNRMRKDAPNA